MMALRSWLEIPAASHFSLANIPFGIISTKYAPERRAAIAIGNNVLDLKAFASGGGFLGLSGFSKEVFSQPTLNAFAALGRPVHRQVREYLQRILSVDTVAPETLMNNTSLRQQALLPRNDVIMHLPMEIGDYTDFYAGLNHAFNVGVLFRGADNALQKNYKHVPIGYHGRSSSIVVSGTPIRRPLGQIIEDPSQPDSPTFTYCRRLDIELELGAFLCTGNGMGEPIPISKAEENIFGLVLLNDWSARDIQAWEYVPLGPFNSKNFASTISPWVVLMDALEPFRTKKLENTKEIRNYLKESRDDTLYDIRLEVDLTTRLGDTTTVTRTSGKELLWSFPQMVAHHSIGGCPLRTGDLLGSGTISGTEPGTLGSLLEQSEGGKKDIMLAGMDTRRFLADGDRVTFRGICGKGDSLIGFGECTGFITPALDPETLS